MKRILTLMALPALLAGCAAPAGAANPRPATTGSAAPIHTTTVSPQTTTSETTTTATPRCHTADLSAKLGTGDGAAGTSIRNLVFTNKSHHPCTLYGYPGVSWVAGDGGTQVNDPFVRDGGTAKTITLARGGVAHAALATHDVGFYPAATCKPVQVRGLRIYPPDEKAAIFVSAPQTVCSAKGVNVGRVQPIASGPGDGV